MIDTMSTGTIAYRCTESTPLTITLSRSDFSTFNARQMRFGNHVLDYNLYQDASGSVIWGAGAGGTQALVIFNPSANTNVRLTIYGRIPRASDECLCRQPL